MNSNVSPISAAQGIQRQKNTLNLSSRIGIDALAGLGAPGSSAPSFSNTLQQQLRPDQQQKPPSDLVREAGPDRSRSNPAEPPTASQAEKARLSEEGSSTAQQQPSPGATNTQAAQSATGQPDASGKDVQSRADTGSEALAKPSGKKTEASDTEPASTDLPALIAALLPGLQASNAAKPAADGESIDALAGDSRQKSLQNSGLLPSMLTDGRKGAQAGAKQGGNGFVAALAANSTPRSGADSLTSLASGAQAGDGLIAQLQARQPLVGTLLADGKAASAAQAGDPDGLHTLTTIGLAHISQRGTAPTSGSLQLPVATPAGREAWAEDVGNQVRWMLGRAESKAELVLTPPNMGKLEVTIPLNGDQTTAQFVASSQAARDALEQALPRLREMLQQAGISLGQTNVSTSGEQGAGGEGRDQGGRSGRGIETSADTIDGGDRRTWLRQHDGLVDTFV